MSRYHSYLNSAVNILDQYKGEEPFSSFLKKFFAANKRFGSTDRRLVSQLCYSYFRLGKAFMNITKPERILIAYFLCSSAPTDLLETLKPEWNQSAHVSIEEKWKMIDPAFSLAKLFPFPNKLSPGIDNQAYAKSFLIQPDLFIRIRPGCEKTVRQKIDSSGLPHNLISEHCISLPNSTKIDELVNLNREAVVQDRNSQKVGELMETISLKKTWDCCAASGGKSLMAYDRHPSLDLYVTDIRPSIIANLKKRFEQAGIKNYHSDIVDLTESFPPFNDKFTTVIADLPCTGSGTWSRTPEQLFYFDDDRISYYASLQQQILENVMSYIEPGGHLLYITCSVFKKENEDNVKFIQQSSGMKLVKMEILKGYDQKADTMFAALLQQPQQPL